MSSPLFLIKYMLNLRSCKVRIISRLTERVENFNKAYMFDVTNYKTLKNENLKNSIDRDGKLFYQRNN